MKLCCHNCSSVHLAVQFISNSIIIFNRIFCQYRPFYGSKQINYGVKFENMLEWYQKLGDISCLSNKLCPIFLFF